MRAGLPRFPMNAKRRRWGTISRKSSRRLPATSVCWSDRPVTLPPGRAREAVWPDRISDHREHDRDDRRRLPCRDDGWCSIGDNDIDLEPAELCRNLGEALAASLRPAILDSDGV